MRWGPLTTAASRLSGCATRTHPIPCLTIPVVLSARANEHTPEVSRRCSLYGNFLGVERTRHEGQRLAHPLVQIRQRAAVRARLRRLTCSCHTRSPPPDRRTPGASSATAHGWPETPR